MSLAGKIEGLVPGIIRNALQSFGVINGSGVYVPAARPTAAITTGVGSETVLTSGQSGYYVSNVGTTVKASCTLPTAAAGLRFFFANVDSDGFRVNASTGDTIRLGNVVSTTAGYVESVTTGSAFTLTAVDSTQWVAESGIVGTWRADSTTSAGFAFTPSAMTTWTSPTTTWVSNVTWTGTYRQTGDILECNLLGAVTGAPTTASLTVTLPTGFTMAANAVAGEGTVLGGGGQAFDDSPGAYYGPFLVVFASTTTVNVHYTNNTSTHAIITQAAPFTWAASDGVHVFFRARVV